MKTRGIAGIAVLIVLAGFAAVALRPSPPALDETEVTRSAFSVWSVYEGKLEARRVEVLMSRLSGNATVVDLVPEGATVTEGDQLVRFDDSALQRELLKLERDHALARSTQESLEQAKLPLELQDLKFGLMEAENLYQTEAQFLADSVELLADGLISESELAQQQSKVDQLKARVAGYKQQKVLTETYLHPAERARAHATLEAAEQELALALEQLKACVMRAPVSGMIAYHPLHIGTEYRTVRVGDTIFKNQPIITIPDMNDIVVDCQVPEAELSRVTPGAQVTVVPIAYPDLQLVGTIQTISSVAQRRPDHPAWQKFFRVVIALDDSEPRLRSGMSVYAQILSYHREDAVVVPRTAITWKDDQPSCRLRGLTGVEVRPLDVGKANTTHYEVLAGLEPGDRVLTP